ncbi:MAG: hypothetical protein ACI4II_03365 [Acutalibacteraceae bacterium]
MREHTDVFNNVLHRRDEYNMELKRRRGIYIKAMGITACLCLAIFAGIITWQQVSLHNSSPQSPVDTPASTVSIKYNGYGDIIYGEVHEIKTWDELTSAERYSALKIDSNEYSSLTVYVDTADIGNKLGTYEVSGYDEYDKRHSIEADVFAINKVSEKCAVYVKLDDIDGYIAFVNPYYKPENLGQFITDLNLTETLSFGSAYYEYTQNAVSETVIYDDFEDKTAWDILLNKTDIQNVLDYDTMNFDEQIISIAVDMPELGYTNRSMWLTKDGYLHTNILETGKAFFIGKDTVERFTETVINTYTGHKISYTNTQEGAESASAENSPE